MTQRMQQKVGETSATNQDIGHRAEMGTWLSGLNGKMLDMVLGRVPEEYRNAVLQAGPLHDASGQLPSTLPGGVGVFGALCLAQVLKGREVTVYTRDESFRRSLRCFLTADLVGIKGSAGLLIGLGSLDQEMTVITNIESGLELREDLCGGPVMGVTEVRLRKGFINKLDKEFPMKGYEFTSSVAHALMQMAGLCGGAGDTLRGLASRHQVLVDVLNTNICDRRVPSERFAVMIEKAVEDVLLRADIIIMCGIGQGTLWGIAARGYCDVIGLHGQQSDRELQGILQEVKTYRRDIFWQEP
ncbi:hypothetical protein ONS96_005276 [Cadophora gregata f. sp. sojae]|nr:hypothetical protein ONS96_005276 [Cadophora gregata f. sp. sojae]